MPILKGFVQFCGKDPIWSNGPGIPSLVCTIVETAYKNDIWWLLMSLWWIINENYSEN